MENSRRLKEVTQEMLVKKKAAAELWKRRNAREKDLEQIIKTLKYWKLIQHTNIF